MSIENLTSSQLRQAADLQERIAKRQAELAAIFGTKAKPASPAVKPAKKGGMSAAGKAKIAAAQKLRWAKVKAVTAKTAPATKVVATKPAKKGGMSAEGKARIVAAQKLRWSKIKAAKTVAKPGAKLVAPKPAKKKFVMSAAAKAKISAAAKARWAKVKASKK